jgi:hypothetical protein
MGRETRYRKTKVGAQKHMRAMKKENKSGWTLGEEREPNKCKLQRKGRG